MIFEKLDNYSPNVKVENICLTHGPFDGIVTFYAPDLISAKMLVDQINSKIGKYFERMLMFETLVTIRKQGIKNPHMENLAEYL